MILDTTANLPKYTALCRGFAAVCRFLEKTDIHTLADGRYPIDGDDVYLTVASGSLRPAAEASLEVHDKYIDIHIPLTGPETMGWRPRSECSAAEGEMSEENDILFFRDAPASYAEVPVGMMAICFTDDAHAPLIGAGEYRKCIFKVRRDG